MHRMTHMYIYIFTRAYKFVYVFTYAYMNRKTPIYIPIYMHIIIYLYGLASRQYGVATISKFLKIIGLTYRISTIV